MERLALDDRHPLEPAAEELAERRPSGGEPLVEALPPAAVPGHEDVRRCAFECPQGRGAKLTVLRDPAAEAETAPQPTLAQLPELVASVERAGVPVVLEVSPGLLDGGLAASTAYRMVQESLSNVLRHAPGAPTVVTLRRVGGDRASLELTIRNGPPPRTPQVVPSGPADAATAVSSTAPVPAPAPAPGHGLIGMRERARLVGGRIDSGPTADGGFEVHAVLPLVGGRPEETP